MGALPKEKEDRRFTYADYKEWELDEGGPAAEARKGRGSPPVRYELIYGEAYAMSGPNTKHQAISRDIFGQFYNYFQQKTCQAFL